MGKVDREKFKVLNGVFDASTLETLDFLRRRKYFDELRSPIKTGKEADVYLAVKENKFVAIKIYRVRAANFKKITYYINRDFRFKNIKGNMRKVIMMWVSKEFRNLLLCHKKGVKVPFPYKYLNNVIIMEYIDGKMLKDTELVNPKEFLLLLIDQLKSLFKSAQLTHGDLSEYNILVEDNRFPVIIDFGQAMNIKNPADFNEFYDLFLRDIENIVLYFNKTYKMDLHTDSIIKEIIQESENTLEK